MKRVHAPTHTHRSPACMSVHCCECSVEEEEKKFARNWHTTWRWHRNCSTQPSQHVKWYKTENTLRLKRQTKMQC